MLVASQRVLHLHGEQIFPVEPLALPPLLPLPDLERLAHYSAVSFFLQRAQTSLPNFRLTSANARAVAELCICVDGLPLAIELVAARLRLLTPQAILTRLTGAVGARLTLLTGSVQERPEHQQTLQRTIDWSYHLLDPYLQTLFVRLAVFVGGCTIEAAEAVCGDENLPLAAAHSDVAPQGSNPHAASCKTSDGLVSLLDQSFLPAWSASRLTVREVLAYQ